MLSRETTRLSLSILFEKGDVLKLKLYSLFCIVVLAFYHVFANP
jgi:hypothetical protein